MESQNNIMKEKEFSPKYSFGSVSLFVFNILLLGLNIYCYLGLLGDQLGVLSAWLTIASVLLLELNVWFFLERKEGWVKVVFVTTLLVAVFTWGYFLFAVFDLLRYINDADAMRELIQSTGIWSYLIFVLVQFLQVTFIPIPAIVTTLAGTVLFGPGTASILSVIGILIGSVVAFVIGDKLGERVVKWIAGEKALKKYGTLLYDKGKYIFFLMLLFPVFPDDVLCLIAGMTTMTYRFFLLTIILTRPIGIVMTCYLGSGDIIPYNEPWGIACWIAIVLFIVLSFWLAYHYKSQIEEGINKFAVKMREAFLKMGRKTKTFCEDLLAKCSKSYKAKLLLKRNRLPYLLLTEGLPENAKVSGRIVSNRSQR